MSLYFPNIILITNVVRDENYKVETRGTPFSSKAGIENEDEVKYDKNGEIINPIMHIILPIETSILKGDYIQIIELRGKVPNKQDGIERKVRKVNMVGSFNDSHIEVLV